MSLGYASRLSHREDLGGRLGDPELSDAPHCAWDKACKLAELIREASKVIVFTGAGISTACGIPDFRGPQGVWTCQRKGLPPPKLQTSFLYAKPSLTHQALLGLLQSGKLDYVCSQNVDSLHLRSGVPRSQIAELHGNCFAERCKKCKKEYVRDFEMDTVGFKPTGRRCTQPNCRGPLIDHILDWEDALPNDEFEATQKHASSADLALCLGTSLQIIPAANLPLRTVKAGGKLAIINLQATPKDKRADVVIHARVDEVMAVVMQQLGLNIPVYTRTDRVQLSHAYTAVSSSSSKASTVEQEQQQRQQDSQQELAAQQPTDQQQGQLHSSIVKAEDSDAGPSAAKDADPPESEAADSRATPEAAPAMPETGGTSSSSGSWGFSFCISSIHGPSCPLPMVASASVAFQGPAANLLKSRDFSGQLPWRLSRTCPDSLQEVQVQVTLQLVDQADGDKRVQQVLYTIPRPAGPPASRPAATRRASAQLQADGSQVFSFVTQVLDYSERQQQLVQQMQTAAEQSRLTAAADSQVAETSNSKGKKRGGSAGSNHNSKQGSAVEKGTPACDVQGHGAGLKQEQPGVQNGNVGGKLNSAGDSGTSEEAERSDAASDDANDSDFVVDGSHGRNSSGRVRKSTKRLRL